MVGILDLEVTTLEPQLRVGILDQNQTLLKMDILSQNLMLLKTVMEDQNRG